MKVEGAGQVRRCLEVRLTLQGQQGLRCVMAYRTDSDRQGESHDVTSWPPWQDPRARTLLPSLLMGLAAKLVVYHVDGVHGLPSSLRAAIGFLRARHYPSRAWLRPFGLALLRRGAPMGLLPRSLRRVVQRK